MVFLIVVCMRLSFFSIDYDYQVLLVFVLLVSMILYEIYKPAIDFMSSLSQALAPLQSLAVYARLLEERSEPELRAVLRSIYRFLACVACRSRTKQNSVYC